MNSVERNKMYSTQQILKRATIGIVIALFAILNLSCVNKNPLEFRYYDKGVQHAIWGRFKEAKEEFTKVLYIDPFYTLAKISLGVVEDAIAQKIRKETAIHLFKATNYLNKSMFGEAIVENNKAIFANPDYAEAYNARGGVYSYIGQYDLAISDFSKAIKINPWDAKAYCNRGSIYLFRSLYDQAISDYSSAILINSQLAEAYCNRGSAYFAKGQYDLAILDFNKAIQININYNEAYYNRGIVYDAKGLYGLAINDFNKAIEITPMDADIYLNKANSCRKAGRTNEAFEAYRKYETVLNSSRAEQVRRGVMDLKIKN